VSSSCTDVSKLSRDSILLIVSEGESVNSAAFFFGLKLLEDDSKFRCFNGERFSTLIGTLRGLKVFIAICSWFSVVAGAVEEPFFAELRARDLSIIFATCGSMFLCCLTL